MFDLPSTMARAFADRQDLLMALIDRGGRLIWMNQAFVSHARQSQEALIGKNFLLGLDEKAGTSPQNHYIQEQLRKGESFQFEFNCQSSDDTQPLWLLVDAQPVQQSDAIVSQYSLLVTDITIRKQTELDLQEAKQLLEQTNEELEARVQQRTFAVIHAKERAEQTLQQLQKTQTKLIQSEKMSSLGQLVAGIAHEINNPVNFIFGNICYAEEYAGDLLRLLELYQKCYPYLAPEVAEALEEIDVDFLASDFPRLLKSMKVGAERIREIVRSLRNFSRLDEAEIKMADIHDGLDSTLMILHHRLETKSASSTIRVIQDYASLPMIECYPGQLNQVFMNILSNAIDALRERDQERTPEDYLENPSQITIQTRRLEGDWIAISIKDNGAGIPEVLKTKLFDPFFTTKPVGKGTGLGLSISHQIVTEKHHGRLYCYSKLGEGSEFIIELPIQQPTHKLTANS